MCFLSSAGNFKPGVYAVSVTGRLPPGTISCSMLIEVPSLLPSKCSSPLCRCCEGAEEQRSHLQIQRHSSEDMSITLYSLQHLIFHTSCGALSSLPVMSCDPLAVIQKCNFIFLFYDEQIIALLDVESWFFFFFFWLMWFLFCWMFTKVKGLLQ